MEPGDRRQGGRAALQALRTSAADSRCRSSSSLRFRSAASMAMASFISTCACSSWVASVESWPASCCCCCCAASSCKRGAGASEGSAGQGQGWAAGWCGGSPGRGRQAELRDRVLLMNKAAKICPEAVFHVKFCAGQHASPLPPAG